MNKKVISIIVLLLMILATVIYLRLNLLPKKERVTPPVITAPTPSPTTSIKHLENIPPLEGGGREPTWFLQNEQEFLKKTPVLQSLPSQELPYFKIGYINEQHLIVYSKTEDKERDYQAAREWFAQNNIDISKIQIEYK